jgi:hypothetical protein
MKKTMETFIEAYRHFKAMRSIIFGQSYRFCWIPINNGNGLWQTIEFFDDEIAKIDINKVQIVEF